MTLSFNSRTTNKLYKVGYKYTSPNGVVCKCTKNHGLWIVMWDGERSHLVFGNEYTLVEGQVVNDYKIGDSVKFLFSHSEETPEGIRVEVCENKDYIIENVVDDWVKVKGVYCLFAQNCFKTKEELCI